MHNNILGSHLSSPERLLVRVVRQCPVGVLVFDEVIKHVSAHHLSYIHVQRLVVFGLVP